MGCYPPLGKIVSKALGKCNGAGRERWREGTLDFDYALAYPPTETHYMRPAARTVTFASNNSIYVIPPSPPSQPQPQPQQQSTPEPQQPQTPPRHEPEQQHQDTPESQPPQPQTTEQPEQPDPPAQTQDDAPPQAEPKPPKGPKRGKKKQPGRVRFGPEPPPPPQQQQEQEQAQQEHAQQSPGNIEKPPDHGPPHGAAPAPTQGQQGYLLRYTPSPLPRWEATPRRHEYFSGEYRSYYPTPVREGIYRIATDANRLTTIFSEENPNACTIV